MGARPLSRLIDNKIKSPLSRKVLFGELVNGGNVYVSLKEDELEFEIKERARPMTKEERKALKRELALAQESKVEIADN